MILNIQSLETPSRSVNVLDQEVIPPTSRLPQTFHGSKPPTVEIQKEKAMHRTAAWMIAGGARIKAVASELGVAEGTVSNWTRQPWFQANVNQIIQDEFAGDVGNMLKSAASTAVLVTMDLMSNSTSDQVRLKAAADILDRFRGKATNFVHHTNHQISETPDKEIQRLEEELKLK
jgi:transposase-like protein